MIPHPDTHRMSSLSLPYCSRNSGRNFRVLPRLGRHIHRDCIYTHRVSSRLFLLCSLQPASSEHRALMRHLVLCWQYSSACGQGLFPTSTCSLYFRQSRLVWYDMLLPYYTTNSTGMHVTKSGRRSAGRKPLSQRKYCCLGNSSSRGRTGPLRRTIEGAGIPPFTGLILGSLTVPAKRLHHRHGCLLAVKTESAVRGLFLGLLPTGVNVCVWARCNTITMCSPDREPLVSAVSFSSFFLEVLAEKA
ncbi:MAG: hypothetical protein A4E62_02496 [Syntrophorhabdus sp. PtaU1.Bin002]|nr:MAG: hypothetical protein A4E58_00839 [Syntrophorhabdus sp. PtaB.Bin006]OPY66425.1 MAG: hypothetical protein A4E62_02496 [Syntrophorhabdus sp. PtaU1.Bin002]